MFQKYKLYRKQHVYKVQKEQKKDDWKQFFKGEQPEFDEGEWAKKSKKK